tara:strand:+ start:2148 stop:2912 length:765 start_codon:yes stop_codon:yes gene_type:complete
MFLKKHYDLIINTCYEEPTKYKETTPQYMKPSNISWWDKLPTVSMDNFDPMKANMKTCVGFIDFYKNAISLPSCFELIINYEKENNEKLDWFPPVSQNGSAPYQNFAKDSHTPIVEIHHPIQWGDAFPDMRQFKYVYPWYVEGPKNHKFLMTNNFWQTKKDLQVLNGVLDFYYQHSLNLQFFMRAKSQRVIFKYGESPAVLVPLNEKIKYKINYNYVSSEEWNKLQANHQHPYIVMSNSYQRYKKTLSKFTKIK